MMSWSFEKLWLGKARIAAARKLGIRLWIMMHDQKSSAAVESCGRVGKPMRECLINSGPAQQRPGQLNRLPASPQGGEFE